MPAARRPCSASGLRRRLLPAPRRAETHLLLQGSNLCVLPRLCVCWTRCTSDACPVFVQITFKRLGFCRRAGHTAVVSAPSVWPWSAAPLLDWPRLLCQHACAFAIREASQLLTVNLRAISCEAGHRCAVIHSVSIKSTRNLPFCYLGIASGCHVDNIEIHRFIKNTFVTKVLRVLSDLREMVTVMLIVLGVRGFSNSTRPSPLQRRRDVPSPLPHECISLVVTRASFHRCSSGAQVHGPTP